MPRSPSLPKYERNELWIHLFLTVIAALWIAYLIRGLQISTPALVMFVSLSLLGVNFACWLGLRIRRSLG
jgi:hypothetical protein